MEAPAWGARLSVAGCPEQGSDRPSGTGTKAPTGGQKHQGPGRQCRRDRGGGASQASFSRAQVRPPALPARPISGAPCPLAGRTVSQTPSWAGPGRVEVEQQGSVLLCPEVSAHQPRGHVLGCAPAGRLTWCFAQGLQGRVPGLHACLLGALALGAGGRGHPSLPCVALGCDPSVLLHRLSERQGPGPSPQEA